MIYSPKAWIFWGLALDILKRLRELWWICLIIVLVCTARGVIKEKKAYRPMYEAPASFAVYAGSDNNTISNYYNKVSAKQLSATFPYILTSGALNKIVAADLGVSAIPGVVSANMLGETNLFQIQVISSDPQSAYDVLQSVIENYPEVARYVIGDTKLKLIDETGVPTAPLNTPQYKKRAVKGAGMGFTLCVLLLAAAEMTRTTVKKREDLKKFLNVKYLTGIPQVRFKKRSDESINQLLRDNPSTPDVYNDAVGHGGYRNRKSDEGKGNEIASRDERSGGRGKDHYGVQSGAGGSPSTAIRYCLSTEI